MIQETSLLANESVKKRKAADAERIYAFLLRQREMPFNLGATCDFVEGVLGIAHTTCSARIRQLVKAGRVRASGCYGKTRTGCKAIIWEAI